VGPVGNGDGTASNRGEKTRGESDAELGGCKKLIKFFREGLGTQGDQKKTGMKREYSVRREWGGKAKGLQFLGRIVGGPSLKPFEGEGPGRE